MSSKKKIAIIGANEFQNDLILKAKEKGFETHVFSWGKMEVGQKNADYFYEYDVLDVTGILQKIKEIGVSGVCSIASDLTNKTANIVASELKLIANSTECLELTSDKFLMRECLDASQISCPSFALLTSSHIPVSSDLNYPLIVKPTDRSGSRGVAKVNNINDLKEAIRRAFKFSLGKRVIVEEFIDGIEFSVESVSQDGKHKILQVTEKITTGAPNFIEVAHISPARISKVLKRQIEELTIKALDVLKVEYGASHTEVKLNSSGELYIIEVGSRMGGDFIGSYLVEKNTGFDFVNAVIQISVGNKFSLCGAQFTESMDKVAMVNYFFSPLDSAEFLKYFGRHIDEFILNKSFSGEVDNSAERHSCVKLTVDKEIFEEICEYLGY